MNKKGYLIIAALFGIPLLILAYVGGLFLKNIYFHQNMEFSMSQVESTLLEAALFVIGDIALGVFLYFTVKKKQQA